MASCAEEPTIGRVDTAGFKLKEGKSCGRGGFERIVEIGGKGKGPRCKTRHLGHPVKPEVKKEN